MAGQSTITAGQKDTHQRHAASGGSPAARRVVDLYRYSDRLHRWRLIRIKLTGKAGAVTFMSPPVDTRIRARLTAIVAVRRAQRRRHGRGDRLGPEIRPRCPSPSRGDHHGWRLDQDQRHPHDHQGQQGPPASVGLARRGRQRQGAPDQGRSRPASMARWRSRSSPPPPPPTSWSTSARRCWRPPSAAPLPLRSRADHNRPDRQCAGLRGRHRNWRTRPATRALAEIRPNPGHMSAFDRTNVGACWRDGDRWGRARPGPRPR